MINMYFIEFAINAIKRSKTKNIFIFIIFSIMIFILFCIFLLTSGIKKELNITVESLPEITIQKVIGQKSSNIDIDIVDEILSINGVQNASDRIWGYYYFSNAKVNFTIVGIDQFDKQYKSTIENITNNFDFSDMKNGMIIGSGVKKILDENYFKEFLNFIKPDGSIKKIYIKGVFKDSTILESNDMIFMPKETVYELFDMDTNKASDIIVKVSNPLEIENIANKIRSIYPFTKVITKDDLKISYENIFDYKSGLFLALFIVCLFTFFMIIYDKSSGLSIEEKREIGILKAVGWSTNDILKEKFYESFFISIFSFLVGLISSYFYIYILQAPFLKELFIGYSSLKVPFDIPFIFDIEILILVFFISVPIYIAATIFPSWIAATIDADEVIR